MQEKPKPDYAELSLNLQFTLFTLMQQIAQRKVQRANKRRARRREVAAILWRERAIQQ